MNKNDFRKYLYQIGLPNNFSLLNLCFLQESLFQFTHKEGEELLLSGINVPWIYFGMLFSTFCWHIEDMYLYSVNYLIEGKPKIWYSVSTKDKEKVDNYIKNKYYAQMIKDPSLIYNLRIHIDPLELLKNGIQVYKTVQNPGEIVVTLPKGYHMGFSLGLNKAEAVNFAVSITILIYIEHKVGSIWT